MKKKIAVFLSDMNYETVHDVDSDDDLRYWTDEGHVQLTEVVEIDFPDLKKEDIVKNQVITIDNKIQDTLAKCEIAVNQLKERKQELLAIGCDK